MTTERDARGRRKATHIDQGTGTEAGASVEPIVVFELVYFDALAVVDGGWRQSHYTGVPVRPVRRRNAIGPDRNGECGGLDTETGDAREASEGNEVVENRGRGRFG